MVLSRLFGMWAHAHDSVSRLTLRCGMIMLLVACSNGKGSEAVCATTKSLLRFDTQRAPLVVSNTQFFSSGGFLEVFTRKNTLGPIDSSRVCTAYIEFSDNPGESQAVLLDESLKFHVYTASHCLDMSKDFSIKLHIFRPDARTYYPVAVQHKLLGKVHELRKAMRTKAVATEEQQAILGAFRPFALGLNELFNQPTQSESSAVGGSLCLKRNDPENQNVCSTYHDLVHFVVEPAASTPEPVIDVLREIRKTSSQKLADWIGQSKLAQKFKNTPNFSLSFADDSATKMNLSLAHKAVRTRVHNYSKFKMLQLVHKELTPRLNTCGAQSTDGICGLSVELSSVIQSALSGTKYERFESSNLLPIIEAVKSEYTASMQMMDTVFTIFDSLIETLPDGSKKLPLDTRIHSNFRFVTMSDPTADQPDPSDPMRAFMVLNVNNLAGDDTGKNGTFVKWNPETKLGRFSHLKIPRTITTLNRDQSAVDGQVPHVGLLQAGDSGSILVIEHLPYFAVTSVDGVATSGGATIRPLPEHIEDESLNPSSDSEKLSGKGVKICH